MTTQRFMYDAVTVANIPAAATMVAGYVDGHYANVDELRRRFPHAELVTITVFGGHTVADVIDCEKGDATPPQAAAWAKWRHAAGAHPTIYCNTSTRPAVIAECHKVGLTLGRDFEIWEAHYDGVGAVPAGDAAKQFLGDYHGYDKSAVVAYWRGVDPAPHHGTPAHYYPVQRGDSLASIAKKFGLTVAELEAMNPGIQSHPLAVGQQVKVRTGTA